MPARGAGERHPQHGHPYCLGGARPHLGAGRVPALGGGRGWACGTVGWAPALGLLAPRRTSTALNTTSPPGSLQRLVHLAEGAVPEPGALSAAVGEAALGQATGATGGFVLSWGGPGRGGWGLSWGSAWEKTGWAAHMCCDGRWLGGPCRDAASGGRGHQEGRAAGGAPGAPSRGPACLPRCVPAWWAFGQVRRTSRPMCHPQAATPRLGRGPNAHPTAPATTPSGLQRGPWASPAPELRPVG